MTQILNARILASLAMLVFVGAIVASSTGAFFSDSETSTGNTFTAGDIDLQIDSVAHYNGMVCTLVGQSYVYIPEANVTLNGTFQPVANANMDGQTEWDAYNLANPTQYPQAGTACTGTWPVGNLNENTLGMDEFFNFSDIKPGDNGENTISVHVGSNDAWMCASIAGITDADNTQTEPEAGDVDDVDDLVSGELDTNLYFFAWRDDGDNVYEPGSLIGTSTLTEVAFGSPVSASSLATTTWTLADGGTGTPIEGGSTGYIGLSWCAGTMSVVGSTISCDGAGMGNEAQTDSWGADLTFYVEQSRNNSAFRCTPPVTQPETGTVTLDKVVTFSNQQIGGVDVTDFQLHLVGPSGDVIVSDEVAATGLIPGAYVVSEVYSGVPGGVTSNATFSGSCTEIGATDTATLNVVAGINPVCTITNSVSLN